MNTILRLFYDLKVYREILPESFAKIFLRFLLAYLLLAGGYVLNFSRNPAVSEVINSIKSNIATLVNTLPDEAVMNLSNYQLSTANLPLPFVLSPYFYLDSTADINALATSSAMVAVGSTHVRFLSDLDTYEVRSYQELGVADYSTTGLDLKNQLTEISHQITRLTPYLPLILLLPVFLGLTLVRFIYSLFYALVFYLVTYLFKGGYNLSEFLKISLHVVIVADILNLAVLLVYGPGYSVVFSLAFVGVSILAYLNLPARITKIQP